MSREKYRHLTLVTGQNDTRIEEGSELPRWPVVRNTRYPGGVPARRKGRKRIAVCGTDAKALDMTAASSHHAQFPAHPIHALTPPFSLEGLIEPDTVTGTQVIVGFGHATDFPFEIRLDGDDLEVDLQGVSAGTVALVAADVAAIDTALYYRVTVDEEGNSALYVDEATTANATDTGSLAGDTLVASSLLMFFGRNNGGNYYDGSLCYFRAVRYVIPDASMAFTRWPTPRASYMLWDYGGEVDANDWVHDRSQYENHGEIANSCGTTTALCVNPAPVQLIRGRRDGDNKTKVFVIAGGRPMDAEV